MTIGAQTSWITVEYKIVINMSFATEIKVIFIFVTLLATAVSAYLISFFKNFQPNEKLLSFSNSFSAAIFLVVGLVHLLHDSQEMFVDELEHDLPLGYIAAIGGYSLILFIENVLNATDSKEDPQIEVGNQVRSSKNMNEDIAEFNEHDNQYENQAVMRDFAEEREKRVKGITFTCELGVRSLFVGTAVGIISDELSLVVLFMTSLIHSIPAVFKLGGEIEKVSMGLKIGLMAGFVMSLPLGIAAGLGISCLVSPIIQAIFLSISAGTFIYMGCTEILPKQFNDCDNKWLKFSGFLIGVVPLTILSVFVHDEH